MPKHTKLKLVPFIDCNACDEFYSRYPKMKGIIQGFVIEFPNNVNRGFKKFSQWITTHNLAFYDIQYDKPNWGDVWGEWKELYEYMFMLHSIK